ncbi:mycothiol synthase [Helcobacillus massiliensis]|uniref:mycothiol synthase n=1 Tax=Helcobacillus massiliensis TaxID=521392 RepID=UPI0021A43E3B|nr:mycothiol synthase [Helcobacillus massiliensis]MCT1556587.1 mycothiol synthase [Helcobacillus massiliensis]MCT2035781.1 mycothiol synthase [Helcobacillus massiliensis]MCT2331137.1 mycothiol synthase [Helcobacillus massiliensis]
MTSDALVTELAPAEVDAVRDLLRTAEQADGDAALDEAARLALTRPGAARHGLITGDGGAALGYVSLLADGTVQGMVHPDHRRTGLGSRLLTAATAQAAADGTTPAVWVHGGSGDSLTFLRSRGFTAVRELLQMRREAAPIEVVDPSAADIAFAPCAGECDLDDLVAVNARAFADHPEQGRLTREDLQARMAEPWFRAEDLLLARSANGDLLGFSWLKREDGGVEVYVVGVDPSAQGQKLGAALTTRGIAAADGAAVDLFADGDNAPAVTMYEKLGFAVTGRHLQLIPHSSRS